MRVCAHCAMQRWKGGTEGGKGGICIYKRAKVHPADRYGLQGVTK